MDSTTATISPLTKKPSTKKSVLRTTINPWLMPSLVIGLLATVVLSVGIGAVRITPYEIWLIIGKAFGYATTVDESKMAILLAIRLPRVCLAVLVGSGLAISGAAIQGLFRNPLADPGLIGISAGASLAAVTMIVLEVSFFTTLTGILGMYALSVVSFIGASLTAFLVYRISRMAGKSLVTTMLLTGIAINALSGALTGIMTYLATDEQLRNITFWSLGSLGGASWTSVLGILPFTVIALFGIPRLAKSLNLLALGESQASMLGINLKSIKRQVIIFSTMAVGTSVAVAGIIGFVGLVIPHLIRMGAGSDHRRVLVGSALGGAIVLTLADSLARTLVAPAELPIGILTALLGTPVFLWILFKQRRQSIS
ncbi:FecCD family ABC transporter permease [Spirosoma endophyticum]|uniref:Iron complex transport system permease protein n=1 Tax=Spirosoma endophyticum TaxID=662367 RepID=A0A1I1PEJ1_9BACT|nr:iron ABC transporter permease [Spirosoma endophyticum]SFD05463.1 iron complex transport system permease protein [Spirosoma endophyticum]